MPGRTPARREGAQDIVRRQLHDDVDALREAQTAVRIDRQTAGHQLAHPGIVERLGDRFETVEFHRW